MLREVFADSWEKYFLKKYIRIFNLIDVLFSQQFSEETYNKQKTYNK